MTNEKAIDILRCRKDGNAVEALEMAIEALEHGVQSVTRWIPIDERLPEVDEDGYSTYVLLSFENATVPTIGTYVQEKDGSGAFHDGDDERTLASYGLFVNAWMPLPDPYRD